MAALVDRQDVVPRVAVEAELLVRERSDRVVAIPRRAAAGARTVVVRAVPPRVPEILITSRWAAGAVADTAETPTLRELSEQQVTRVTREARRSAMAIPIPRVREAPGVRRMARRGVAAKLLSTNISERNNEDGEKFFGFLYL